MGQHLQTGLDASTCGKRMRIVVQRVCGGGEWLFVQVDVEATSRLAMVDMGGGPCWPRFGGVDHVRGEKQGVVCKLGYGRTVCVLGICNTFSLIIVYFLTNTNTRKY